jgi:hypothetical protein
MPTQPPKDPIVMGVLSLFLPWLGQLLIGQVAKAVILFFVVPVVLGFFILVTAGLGLILVPFLLPLLNVAAAIDAYLLAKKLQEGRAIGQWEFFGHEPAPAGVVEEVQEVQEVRPVVRRKARPAGLVAISIAQLVVIAFPLVVGVVGLAALVVDKVNGVGQIVVPILCVHLGWLIFSVVQTLRLKRYAIAVTAPLILMPVWFWLFGAGDIPLGLLGLGIVGSIAVGVWSLNVLLRPEVRGAFENQSDPLASLLPLGKGSIIGLAVAGGVVVTAAVAIPLVAKVSKPSQIVGKWHRDANYETTLTFTKEGDLVSKRMWGTSTSKYKQVDSRTIEVSSKGERPEKYTIVWLSSNRMTLTDEKGSADEYHK